MPGNLGGLIEATLAMASAVQGNRQYELGETTTLIQPAPLLDLARQQLAQDASINRFAAVLERAHQLIDRKLIAQWREHRVELARPRDGDIGPWKCIGAICAQVQPGCAAPSAAQTAASRQQLARKPKDTPQVDSRRNPLEHRTL
ncbi:MAG: hypothetical protein R3E72_03935 [Steroidobacteraceae bacterium]